MKKWLEYESFEYESRLDPSLLAVEQGAATKTIAATTYGGGSNNIFLWKSKAHQIRTSYRK